MPGGATPPQSTACNPPHRPHPASLWNSIVTPEYRQALDWCAMSILAVLLGDEPAVGNLDYGDAATLALPRIPGRKDFGEFMELIAGHTPDGLGPGLEELQKQPDLAPPGQPVIQNYPGDRLRVVVAGTDAGFAAVATKLMRTDNLWVDLAYLPAHPGSAAATNYGIPTDPAQARKLAFSGQVHPVPLIRDDSAQVVFGCATVTDAGGGEVTGEIIVDDHVLLNHRAGKKRPARGRYGARLVAMKDQPGIAAVLANTPLESAPAGAAPSLAGKIAGLFGRKRTQTTGTVAPDSLATGRALQAGGINLQVTVDGVARPRPVERATFYRHLRDLQLVRPAS